VPLIARIIRVQAADDDRACLVEGRVVSDTEVHGFQAAVGRCDGFDVGHAERRFNECFHADLVRQALGNFDLADDGFDSIDVGWNADLRNEDGVEVRTGLLADIDNVAIHVVGVEAVDANRDALAGCFPIEIVQRLNDVLTGLLFFRWRDGVFAIKKYVVGSALEGAVDHGRVRARHCKIRTLQALFACGVKCVAHVTKPSLECLWFDCG
jgi:hypothetical protein